MTRIAWICIVLRPWLVGYCDWSVGSEFEPLSMGKSHLAPERWLVNSNQKLLLEIMPDAWSGNANAYALEGDTRIGHFWSQFLMFSEGNWLTDKVESEGFKLLSFDVLDDHGDTVRYKGKWQFWDYFTSEAEHLVWAKNGTVLHHVKTILKVQRQIPQATAVWVEFFNDEDAFSTVAAKTTKGVIEKSVIGTTNRHYLDEMLLHEKGWIAVYGPQRGQEAIAALVPLKSSDPVRPRVNDSHCDNIELHLLDPQNSRDLRPGRSFELEYMLLIHTDANGWKWIDGKVKEAEADLKRLLP